MCLWSGFIFPILSRFQLVPCPLISDMSYLFTSHDDIHHVRIQWKGNPLLLFSDPNMVPPCGAHKFQEQASHVTHQQHLQMGLSKGMAVLVYYMVGDLKFQVVLLAPESVLGRGKKGDHRLWKRVTLVVTGFVWLPPAIAVLVQCSSLPR